MYFRVSVCGRQMYEIMKTKVYKIFLLFISVIFLSITSVSAVTKTVGNSGTGADYTSLQNAVNNASYGDTLLLLSDITIDEQLSFSRKLTVRSDNGYSIKKGEELFQSFWTTISIYINSDLELINVNLDVNNKRSNAIFSEYAFYVSVNSGATLTMSGTSTICNATEGAVLSVGGTVIGGRVTNNKSSSTSVGVVYVLSQGRIINMVIDSNTLNNSNMGAVALNGGSMINCTVINNKSGNSGNRYGVSSNNPNNGITNCIIYNNGAGIYGKANVSYSCVQGGATGTGNINADPLLNSNFTLKSESPCINVGDNGAIQSYASIDFWGNPRISDKTVDMGACEYLKCYVEKEDVRVSCGKPLVWIDGKTYKEDNNTALDTVYGITCDTIMKLNFKRYKAIDKSSLTEEALQKKACPTENVVFDFNLAVNGRTSYQWLNEANEILSTNTSLTVPADFGVKEYRFVAATPDGLCADTTTFQTKADNLFEVQNPAALSLDSAANKGCLLRYLNLTTILPTFTLCEAYKGGEIVYYYSVNEGDWIQMNSSSLLDVADGTRIMWRVNVTAPNGEVFSGETTEPVVVHVSDKEKPDLDCEMISVGKRVFPVADSVNGMVPASIKVADIMDAATDNCSDALTLLFHTEGGEFSPFLGVDSSLNVFTHPSETLYWKVVDEAGNESDVCAVTYEVERNTTVDGKQYAIVKDTSVCSLPLTWHGYTFAADGERAEVGAALLGVKVIEPLYQRDTIIRVGSYTWRNGVTYTESTDVEYRKANEGACDSIYTLHLTITDHAEVVVETPVTPIDSVADQACLLSRLDLNTLVPSYQYTDKGALDTTIQYQIDGGAWVNLKDNNQLTDVANGTSLLWRVTVTSADGTPLSDETTVPQVIRLADKTKPQLDCDKISVNHRVVAVADSVNGEVSDLLTVAEVLNGASDNCSNAMSVWISTDDVTYYAFSDYVGHLNVFTHPSENVYWKVRDEAGNESDGCMVTYEVARETEAAGKKYAIVRDTMVCSFPVTWHGHTFSAEGEKAEVGAALLTVKVDSSFYKRDTVLSKGPYTWRNGVTYDESTVVEEYRKANVGSCDSIYSLFLKVKENAGLIVENPKTPIDSFANKGCLLAQLDLTALTPDFTTTAADAKDTTLYYQVDGGEWVDLKAVPQLTDVADGTSLMWRVTVTTAEDTPLSDETFVPQIIRVSDTIAPQLTCDLISQNHRVIAVADSVNGVVPFSLEMTEVMGAVTENCSDVKIWVSADEGATFTEFTPADYQLNVYTQTSQDLLWKVTDVANNSSAVCAVTYSVERETSVGEKKYAIVRDTMVCQEALPVVWHGHTFTAADESAEVGAALLTLKVKEQGVRYDTMVVCGVNYYNFNGVDYPKGVHDISYTLAGGADVCDSLINLHLTVVSPANKPVADTVVSSGCKGDRFTVGFSASGMHTVYNWYIQGELQTSGDWVGVTRTRPYYSGYDNYQYMLVRTTPEGYCPDTTVYITYSSHLLESGDVKPMLLFAGEDCKATIRLRDYMPAFSDLCSYEVSDTFCAYNVNRLGEQLAGPDDTYTFVDGDSISWSVGIYSREGTPFSVSNPDFHQRVTVVDTTAPRVDEFGISYLNRVKEVTDSVVGDVILTVPTSDVTDHVSDNCVDPMELKIQYSYDGLVYSDFAGLDVAMNVYDSPTKLVYYAISDKRGNKTIDTVRYRIERKSFVGEDSFAVVRDTLVCPSDLPFVWHGASFKASGASQVVGAAHLTVNVVEGYEKTDTVIVCDSYIWRDGIEYTASTREPVFVVNNGPGECDSLVHLNLTVLNANSGKDSIVVCVRELPYVWNGYSLEGDSTLTLRNVYGCDSVVDVKVVVLPIATETIYDTACVSYTLNDSVYTKSGTYEQTLTSQVTGCDSILTLHLVINEVAKSEMFKTVCGSFELNDSIYTETGDYTQHLQSKVTGCDSILTLHLTVKPLSYGADTVHVCEGELPIVWHNRVLKGDSLMTFVNSWGCDSIVDVKVIVHSSVTTEVSDTACGSYELNGVVYNKSSDYMQRLTSSTGCDSIVILHLTILDPIPQTNLHETVCGSYTLNDTLYTESGVYEQHLTASNGCDSIVMLYLEILPAITHEFKDSVRGAYHWNDSVYYTSGLYQQTFVTEKGCDSIVSLDLKIMEAPKVILSDTVCSSEGIVWNGVRINESGVYPKVEPTAFGDDSTTILYLTVLPSASYMMYDTAYGSYRLNDSIYTQSGIYEQKLVAANGCDSTLILNLKIKEAPITYLTESACGSYAINGSIYTESGRYQQILTRLDGTDSLVVLDLTVWPIAEVTIQDTACGEYEWNGVRYTESGLYSEQFLSIHGCDSIVHLELTIMEIPVFQIVDTACGSYTLNDSLYTKSGRYEQRITRADGCDSLVKLNLTILKAPITYIYDTVCISYRLNDSVYTESGVFDQRFVAHNGCDSIVRLNLVVLNSPTSVYYDTVCASYNLDGQIITESTEFDKKIPLASGCDSVIRVHLTILPIKYDTLYASSCGEYLLNDSLYTESGIYHQTLTSSLGCDSLLTLYLTILEPTYGKDTVSICENVPYVLWHNYQVSSDTSLTIRNAMGCDSIVEVTVVTMPTRRSEVSDTACAPYYWHGREYLVSGDFKFDTISSIGCDSVETLHLTILPSYEIFLQDSAVSYYEWNGIRYDSTGRYTQQFISSLGCDSVVTKRITIVEPPADAPVKVNSCVSYRWQGKVLTESGIYYEILKDVAGEDSIVAIDLTIHQPKYNPDTIHYTVCENELPVVWNGFEISNEFARVILQTKEGCDSFINFRLHIMPTYDTLESAVACDSYTWHGQTFTKSGLYYDTLQSVTGCDSTFTLSLNLKFSTVTEISRTVCESELPIRWNEYEFYRDTIITFPSENGCDSIIKVDLTVNKEYHLEFNEVACGDFYWQGQLLTASGTYVDSFSTKGGCDSIVTLNLIVSHPYYVELVDTTVAGSVYEKNGFTVDAQSIGQYDYEVTLKSQYGCDSLVHLSLYVDGREIDVKWTNVSGGVVDYLNGVRWERKFCASDEYFANYRIRSGAPDSFKISFDHEGIQQGFKNVSGRIESTDSVGYISFIVPDGLEPGRYKVYVQLFGEGKASKLTPLKINVGLDYRRVSRMWSDVAVFDNSDGGFVSYQWKKNNVDIPNATGQYYCEYNGGLNGFYSLDVVNTQGDTLYVCGRYFEPQEMPFKITTYPVYSNSGRVTVYAQGVEEEDLQGARMYVYTLNGVLTYWTNIVHKETEIFAREGSYVCIVILEDQRSATCRFVSHAEELRK